MLDTIALKNKDKADVALPGSKDAQELVFRPPVDITETDVEITMVADMPGVSADDIKIDLREDEITIEGRVRPWEGAEESDVAIEFEIGRYFRRFRLPRVVDRERIDARYSDGTLRLILPKAAHALPRSIQVKNA